MNKIERILNRANRQLDAFYDIHGEELPKKITRSRGITKCRYQDCQEFVVVKFGRSWYCTEHQILLRNKSLSKSRKKKS